MLNDENRYLFKFAWKSIRRHAGRSFFIGFSVSLAVIIAVWVVSFFDGFNAQIEKAVVNTNIGFFRSKILFTQGQLIQALLLSIQQI